MFWNRRFEEDSTRVIEMREAVVDVFIEAPPEKVWECLSDVRQYDQWVTWFKARLPDHLSRIEKAGDYFDYETTILGVKFKGRMMAVERHAPVRSVFCLVSAYRGGGEYLLEPLTGGTRVRYTVWNEIPSSYLGKAIDRALLADTALRSMSDHLARLKAYVEKKED
jgi:uncharacterized membrane protein